ncbi:lamin tail domain-containing protein [Streptosporangium sp. KLBMP 9127]|nr:lamin tail domain-containing protein [Streptosporangium sp. KLBMP 9127]
MKKTFLTLAAAVAVVGLAAAGASAAADPDLSVTRVNYNATGADTAANRWQEAIYLKNTSGAELEIGGWKVHDSYRNADDEHTNGYTFPAGTKVKAGGLVVVSSAAGVNKTDPNKTQAFFMDFRRGYYGHWINNGGDTLTVRKANGDVVTSFSFDFDSGYYVR